MKALILITNICFNSCSLNLVRIGTFYADMFAMQKLNPIFNFNFIATLYVDVTTGHSDHAVTRDVWRFASPRLRLGIVASLLSVSIGSQHTV